MSENAQNIIETSAAVTSVSAKTTIVAAGATASTNVTLTGAAVGMFAQASFSVYNANIEVSAVVSAANTVTVKFKNNGATAVDLASGTINVTVQ